MSDVDRAFYELTVAQRDAAWRECDGLRDRIEQLERERDAAQRDAERYQWLIDNGYIPGGAQFWWASNEDYNVKARAAIDAARSA